MDIEEQLALIQEATKRAQERDQQLADAISDIGALGSTLTSLSERLSAIETKIQLVDEGAGKLIAELRADVTLLKRVLR